MVVICLNRYLEQIYCVDVHVGDFEGDSLVSRCGSPILVIKLNVEGLLSLVAISYLRFIYFHKERVVGQTSNIHVFAILLVVCYDHFYFVVLMVESFWRPVLING